MKTAMVWGASGAIGRALVEELLGQGWQVVALTRSPEALEGTAAVTCEVDVSQPDAVQRAIYCAAQAVDAVDLWIYAIGDITAASVAEMAPADWARILNANLSGAFLATQASLPLLAPGAHLVFIGAVSERLRLPGLAAYVAAKAGLEAFAAVLAKEERKRRVTVVRPGAVLTPFWDKVPFSVPKDAPPPAKVARRILAAHEEGHKGTLDLV